MVEYQYKQLGQFLKDKVAKDGEVLLKLQISLPRHGILLQMLHLAMLF